MTTNVERLVKEHHAFYEVSPYYVVVIEHPGSSSEKTKTIQAGFDLDVFGTNTARELLLPGSDYAVSYVEIQRIAKEVAHHATDRCSVQVIASPERVVFSATSHGELQAMLRIRISHYRGLDQPYGAPEEEALKTLEEQLKQLGMSRR
ncbi:MAG: hypothetical protein JOZ43_00815 [Acidobacteriales bacterium]|nr:hypothetical protein [Terriglobales bacterium]